MGGKVPKATLLAANSSQKEDKDSSPVLAKKR